MGQGFRRIRWNFTEPPQPENGGVFSEYNIRVLLSSRFLATDLNMHDLTLPKYRLRVQKQPFESPIQRREALISLRRLYCDFTDNVLLGASREKSEQHRKRDQDNDRREYHAADDNDRERLLHLRADAA